MKIRIEQSDRDEIVIRCREINDRSAALFSVVDSAVNQRAEMLLFSSSDEHFVSKEDILFFESSDGKVYAHTSDRVYTAPHKLFELEELMPSYFVRISKSVIANIRRISSVHRELSGGGEISFRESDKKTYFSRAYHKLLQHKINEIRL